MILSSLSITKLLKIMKKMHIDETGSPISVVRMHSNKAYVGVPSLLKEFIEKNDEESWNEICTKIDYIYENINTMLEKLDEKNDFLSKINIELEKGKILLFKPNLVSPACINPVNYGPDRGHKACTEWPFIAALMRWFHDFIPIKYTRMALGEAASVSTMVASMYNNIYMPEKKITTEAIFEGKSEDFYGGWGFYFVRKYLQDRCKDPTDNPMSGYKESIDGIYVPPGKASGRMMIYDLNKLNDLEGKARTVPVKNGVNYSEITLPKVLIGGDPTIPGDLEKYPGAILVNVPRLKLHGIDLLTNAIKNLGIGLYPMEIGESGKLLDTHWKYSYPYKEIPGMKTELPHSIWVPEFDIETGLPIRDKNGEYKVRKTGGIAATQVDVIEATIDQGVYILHIVDGIESVNINHAGAPIAREVPEGLAIASEDPVALDLLCARYIFKNIPRKEAKEIGLDSDFLQRVPLPEINNDQITTKEGYDSPLFRYSLYEYAEKRGIGSQDYHVVGWDEITNNPFASMDGHLGVNDEEKFEEIITSEFYYNPTNLLWGLQRTAFNYLRSNDKITGKNYLETILDVYDEDKDGWLNYDEMGKDAFWHSRLRLAAYCYHLRGLSILGSLKSGFLLNAMWRYINPNWNEMSHDFMKNFKIAADISMAFELSKLKTKKTDLIHKKISYGEGYWPSMDFVGELSLMMKIFGESYPSQVSLFSLYGYAFQYADKTQLNGFYTGNEGLSSDSGSLTRYLNDLAKGTRLDFTVFVPEGFATIGGKNLPHLVETTDRGKIFTAVFPNEKWRI
jgi:hypothetical protein